MLLNSLKDGSPRSSIEERKETVERARERGKGGSLKDARG